MKEFILFFLPPAKEEIAKVQAGAMPNPTNHTHESKFGKESARKQAYIEKISRFTYTRPLDNIKHIA